LLSTLCLFTGAHGQVQPTFTTFDAPGAGRGPRQGTYPFAINSEAAITGYYCDAITCHGFVRDGDGTFTTFDVPNDVNGTYPLGINQGGAITGYWFDANYNNHGFIRDRDGTLTAFDVPNDVNGTQPTSIDPEGTITGNYCDVNLACHGFLRDGHGNITTFDVPGDGTGNFLGTYPASINPQGVVSGCYTDANSVTHGFLRDPNGTMTTFDGPHGTDAGIGQCFGYVFPSPGFAINPEGAITGTYFKPMPNPFGGDYRGFLRNPDGSFATFDAATYSPCCIWTFGLAINSEGAIAGYYNDGLNVNHGFLRDSQGTITTLDAPGAGTGPLGEQGTFADGINPSGQITGYYVDSGYVRHGFLLVPQVAVSPANLNFGDVELGRPAKKVVTLENLGVYPVEIGPITFSVTTGDASQFSDHVFCSANLGAGKSCTLAVFFTPDAVGTDAATLNIVTSAPGSPIEIPITAAGKEE